jgi:hypothetical protein
MELKPTKGLRVRVNASREAVFGEEEVSVKKVSFPDDKSRSGTMTGVTLAGYCEVEMPNLDGRRHWYPIDSVFGENGERLSEEEIQIDEAEDEDEE